MAKKSSRTRKNEPTRKRQRRSQRKVAILGSALCLALAVGVFARLAVRRQVLLPTQPVQDNQNLSLSKEYIYAGGRLVATEAPTPTAPCPPPSSVKVIISEFRFRGPQGANDEFVELYNASDSPVSVCASDGTTGWTIASRSSEGAPTLMVTIANGTTIPARGHYLAVASSYSLGTNTNEARFAAPSTPGGLQEIINDPVHAQTGDLVGVIIETGTTVAPNILNSTTSNLGAAQAVAASTTSLTRLTANGDGQYSTDTADNTGVALFSTSNPVNFTVERRLDAVGFSSMSGANADLYREAAGLAPISGDGEYSFVRKNTSGWPQDTNNNAADFFFISTDGGTFGGVASILGGPGPENVSSPIRRNVAVNLFDPGALQGSPPNRVYCGTCTGPNGQWATLTVRRTFTNNTGQTITRLRIRTYEITTLNSPGYTPGGGQADLRILSSSDATVTRTDGSTATVRGIIVETPPDQPYGGGQNTSLLLPLGDAGLGPGESISAQFLLGVHNGGYYRFYVVMEALP